MFFQVHKCLTTDLNTAQMHVRATFQYMPSREVVFNARGLLQGVVKVYSLINGPYLYSTGLSISGSSMDQDQL